MSDSRLREVFRQLDALRAELADLAFILERRGRRDAADVAMTISLRVAELRGTDGTNETPTTSI